jgi:hypothetical protein
VVHRRGLCTFKCWQVRSAGCLLLHRLDLAGDLINSLGGLICQMFHLVGHDGKTLACLSGACSLDRSIEFKQIGLAS